MTSVPRLNWISVERRVWGQMTLDRGTRLDKGLERESRAQCLRTAVSRMRAQHKSNRAPMINWVA